MQNGTKMLWVTTVDGGQWQNEAGEKLEGFAGTESGHFRAYQVLNDGQSSRHLIVLMGPTVQYLCATTLEMINDVQWIHLGSPPLWGTPGPVVPNTFEKVTEGGEGDLIKQIRNHYQSQGVDVAKGVSWPVLRTWYTDDRFEKVRTGLKERLLLYINKIWPEVVKNNHAFDVAEAIMNDLTVSYEDGHSHALAEVLELAGIDGMGHWSIVRDIQAALGRVLIAGPIQTPWERGEEIDWPQINNEG